MEAPNEPSILIIPAEAKIYCRFAEAARASYQSIPERLLLRLRSHPLSSGDVIIIERSLEKHITPGEWMVLAHESLIIPTVSIQRAELGNLARQWTCYNGGCAYYANARASRHSRESRGQGSRLWIGSWTGRLT
jgi:hypothetical protein